ncbi:calphotin-like [Varroa destructor]|uniref:Uncharacterized protein n=1 Tax=Varroa destructor TaxID=109461 RepID=A0A7M7K8N5_VARDE|nr:calphotin-like [Varroa destructor]
MAMKTLIVAIIAAVAGRAFAQYTHNSYHHIGSPALSYSRSNGAYGAPVANTGRITASALPLTTVGTVAAAPVVAGVAPVHSGIASSGFFAPKPAPKVHTIHTHSGRQHIRIEEFRAPAQVIRVHEAPQAAPQVVHVHAPPSPQSVVRVISRASGPAHIERVVHPAPGVQVVDVHRPPPPAARIVQIVRGPAPLPQILFYHEPQVHAELHVESPHAPAPAVATPTHAVVPPPAVVRTVAAFPAVSSSDPIVRAVVAAPGPIVQTPVAAPAPAPAPVVLVGVGYTMYGMGYGRVYPEHFKSKAAKASRASRASS